MFDRLVDAVYLIDPHSSNIIWCNKAAYADLGYEPEEILNHSVLSLQKDVQGLPQWSEIAKVIEAQDCYTFVGRHQHKDGSEIAVEVNTSHFEEGGQKFFLSIARNISNRLALEAELKSKDHRIWFALNEASDGLWEWDIQNDSVFFSPQLKKMLGYGPDEMTPHLQTWINNVHPQDLCHLYRRLWMSIYSEKGWLMKPNIV